MKTKEEITVTAPAGEYFLGDPCYAVPQDDWMPLLQDAKYFDNPTGTVNGYTVIGFNTAYGDGSYRGTDGFDYGVDAGLIGLTPMSATKTPRLS